MEVNEGNLDQQLINEYLEAIYEVTELGFIFKIATPCPPLKAILNAGQYKSFAFITAFNPKSKLFTLPENKRFHKALLEVLKTRRYPYFKGRGIDPKGKWPDETNLLILDIPREEALQLGRQFNQNAIVFGKIGGVGQLVFCK